MSTAEVREREDGSESEADDAVDALHRLDLLDTPPEERFDRITRLAQSVFDVPYAFVNLVDADGLFSKSQLPGQEFTRTPLGVAFCDDTVQQSHLLEIPDATKDPRYADRAAVTEFGVRFYAGYPLQVTTGETVGTLCVMSTEPRELDADKRHFLEQLGRWAQAEIQRNDPVSQGAAASGAPSSVSEATPEPDAAPDDRPPHSSPVRSDYDDAAVSAASIALPYGTDSGDCGAWRQRRDRFLVTLTDVMGKGSTASELAQTLVSALHDRPDDSPVGALTAVEAALGEDIEDRGTFATVFHAAIDTSSGRVDYVDAGHGLNLHIRPDGTATRLSSHNLPLGLRPEGLEWESGELTIASGDILVTVSDGALDAYDSTLDSLRLIGDELRHAHDAHAFFDELTVRVSEHTVDDDVTAVVISVL